MDNVREIIKRYDVVLDRRDNFSSRFLLNGACVMEKTPLVHSAVLRSVREIMTILPGSACYRCVFPEAHRPVQYPHAKKQV